MDVHIPVAKDLSVAAVTGDADMLLAPALLLVLLVVAPTGPSALDIDVKLVEAALHLREGNDELLIAGDGHTIAILVDPAEKTVVTVTSEIKISRRG